MFAFTEQSPAHFLETLQGFTLNNADFEMERLLDANTQDEFDLVTRDEDDGNTSGGG